MSPIVLSNISMNHIGLKVLWKNLTCFENPGNLSCIDPNISISLSSSQNSCVVETAFSDLHKVIVLVIKITFQKLKPKVAHYWNYMNFLMRVSKKTSGEFIIKKLKY